MSKPLTAIKQEITELMNTAIAQFSTNPTMAGKAKTKAEALFNDTSYQHARWADKFAPEYNALLQTWRDLFPKMRGNFVTRSREIGYTGHQYKVWIEDKHEICHH